MFPRDAAANEDVLEGSLCSYNVSVSAPYRYIIDLCGTDSVNQQAKANDSPLRLGINDTWFHRYLQQATGALAVPKPSLLGGSIVSNAFSRRRG